MANDHSMASMLNDFSSTAEADHFSTNEINTNDETGSTPAITSEGKVNNFEIYPAEVLKVLTDTKRDNIYPMLLKERKSETVDVLKSLLILSLRQG